MALIALRDVLQQLRSGQPCTISVCEFNATDKVKQAKRVTYRDVVLVQSDREYLSKEFDRAAAEETVAVHTKRNPRHWLHGTLNIRLKNMDIRKLHIPLMEFFNDKEIVL